MNKYNVKAIITDKGFIQFRHATLVVKSENDWYISVSDAGEKNDKEHLELVIETEEGKCFLTKGDYFHRKITGSDMLVSLKVG